MPAFVPHKKKSLGRGGRLWENCKKVVYSRSTLCWICSGECPDFQHPEGKLPFGSAAIDMSLEWPHPASKSVDHITPISDMSPDDPRLWSPDHCRPAHLSCNSKRGNRRTNRKGRALCKTSRDWLA